MIIPTQFLAISFPEIDPVLLQIGPFAIRWYALAYITGLVLGWRMMVHFVRGEQKGLTAQKVDDFLVWATLGVILGGRVGYVLFYKPDFYFANPTEIFMVWQGGMSFHGGFLGVVISAFLFCRKHKIEAYLLADLLSVVAPIGLFFGRIANFINGELFGRVTDVPWAMVFPHGGNLPRHPSQLYEAALEGLLLFIILMVAKRSSFGSKPGALTGIFLLGYAAARGFVELYRQPDDYLGFLIGGLTMGQLLSIPMILVGVYLLARPGKSTA